MHGGSRRIPVRSMRRSELLRGAGKLHGLDQLSRASHVHAWLPYEQLCGGMQAAVPICRASLRAPRFVPADELPALLGIRHRRSVHLPPVHRRAHVPRSMVYEAVCQRLGLRWRRPKRGQCRWRLERLRPDASGAPVHAGVQGEPGLRLLSWNVLPCGALLGERGRPGLHYVAGCVLGLKSVASQSSGGARIARAWRTTRRRRRVGRGYDAWRQPQEVSDAFQDAARTACE